MWYENAEGTTDRSLSSAIVQTAEGFSVRTEQHFHLSIHAVFCAALPEQRANHFAIHDVVQNRHLLRTLSGLGFYIPQSGNDKKFRQRPVAISGPPSGYTTRYPPKRFRLFTQPG